MLPRTIFKLNAAGVREQADSPPPHLTGRRAIPHGKFLAEVLAKIRARGWRAGTVAAHIEGRGDSFYAAVPVLGPHVAIWGQPALGLSASLTPGKSYRRYYVGGTANGGGGFVMDRTAANRLTGETAVVDPVDAALDWWESDCGDLDALVNGLKAIPLNAARRSRILFEAADKGLLLSTHMLAVGRDYRAGAGTSAWDLAVSYGRVINSRKAPSDQLDQMYGFMKLLRARVAERTGT